MVLFLHDFSTFHFGEIFFSFLSLPLYPTWYLHIFLSNIGLLSDPDFIERGFGLWCKWYECPLFLGLDSFIEFAVYMLLSFSGALWSIPQSSPGLFLPANIIFFTLMYFISVYFDTRIQTYIALKNQKNSRPAREKIFIKIYTFWRIFLPDVFIFGALLAKICNIKFSPEKILQINRKIQVIRICLFVLFFFISWKDFWEGGVVISHFLQGK